MNQMTKRLLLLFFIVAAVVAIYIGGRGFITLDGIKYHAHMLQQLVKEHYAVVVFAYISFYIVALALSMPVSAIMTITGGFLFGTFLGALYATIAATVGSILAFLLIRYFFGTWLQKKYANTLDDFNEHLKRYGYNYMLAVRLASIFPAFLINLFAGLTQVPLSAFAITTAIGLIPSEFVFAFAGQQLTELSSVHDIFSFKILLAFALLALLALSPVIARKVLPKKFF
jgi:uncharacterized membrane protein YdjX (TVP38/TMEM64 family)